LTYISDKGRIW